MFHSKEPPADDDSFNDVQELLQTNLQPSLKEMELHEIEEDLYMEGSTI